MNFLQVKLFIKTVQYHSIHKAGEYCNISPQGASKALLCLEQELGVTLLKRSNRKTLPTKAGEALYQRFVHLSNTYDEILAFIAANDYYAGSLTIVAIPRFVDAYLSQILAALYDEQPEIDIHIKSLTQRLICQELVSDPTVHLGIHTLFDFAHTKQKALAYLEQNNLVFAPFYTCEVYACALQSVICQFNSTIDPFRNHDFPYVAYKYDPFFIDNSETSDWEKCSYQIDSIASQLQLINTRQAIGTFNLDEFRLFFDPKRHGYLPYTMSST